MKIFPTLQKLNTFNLTLKKKKFKFFFYSILKNFSFFYNKLYFKSFGFRIKNKNSLSFLVKKVFSLKKWIFFFKNFQFLKKKNSLFLYNRFKILKIIFFKIFFKRFSRQILEQQIKNPLFTYQKVFSFKLVKLFFRLKNYRLYNINFKKKKFYFRLLTKTFDILRILVLKFPELKIIIKCLKTCLKFHSNRLRFRKFKKKQLLNSKSRRLLNFKNRRLLKNKILIIDPNIIIKKCSKSSLTNLNIFKTFKFNKNNKDLSKRLNFSKIFGPKKDLKFFFLKKSRLFLFKNYKFIIPQNWIYSVINQHFRIFFAKTNTLCQSKYLYNKSYFENINKLHSLRLSTFSKILNKTTKNSDLLKFFKMSILNSKITFVENAIFNFLTVKTNVFTKKKQSSFLQLKKNLIKKYTLLINKFKILVSNLNKSYLKIKTKRFEKNNNYLFLKRVKYFEQKNKKFFNKFNNKFFKKNFRFKVIVKNLLNKSYQFLNSTKFKNLKVNALTSYFNSNRKILKHFFLTNGFLKNKKFKLKIKKLKYKELKSKILKQPSRKIKPAIKSKLIKKQLNFLKGLKIKKNKYRRMRTWKFFNVKRKFLRQVFRFNKKSFSYKQSKNKIANYFQNKRKTKCLKRKKFYFIFRKLNSKKKSKFNSIYFLNLNFLKKINLKFLYKFFLFRQKIKLLNYFKNKNKALILNFKQFKFKKFFLDLKYSKLKYKYKFISFSNVLQLSRFKKYQNFKNYKKAIFKSIPNFFLQKKRWKFRNLKFKINKFMIKFFRFKKSQKKKKFEVNFKRFCNYRGCFGLKLKTLWDRKSFLNFQSLRNKVLRRYKFRKLNYLLKIIVDLSFLKIFYLLLLKNKKKNILFFKLFSKKKNFILFIKNKLLKKSFFLIKNFLNVFFFKMLKKKIRFLFLKKKNLIYKKLILKWFLKQNFLNKKQKLNLKRNSNFFFLFKTKFKCFFLKNFSKIQSIWNFLFLKIKNFYWLESRFKYWFFSFKKCIVFKLKLKKIKNFLKNNLKFNNFFLWMKNTRRLKYKKKVKKTRFFNFNWRRRVYLVCRKIPISKRKTLTFSLKGLRIRMIKFFSYFKKKKFFLQYRFKKCFSPIRRSFWIKTKYFFQKLALSVYSKLIYFKRASKLLMTRRQLFYILKVATNTEVLQDSDYAKRKVFSLRKFNTRYKKNSLKKFLFLKNFSKKIYLYNKFFKYLKVLRKIKNQFFFKKKKFIEIFFLRLDIFLSETKFLGPLKTVRQLIELNYIHLNLKVETKPNSVLKLLDIINICKKANSWLCLMRKNSQHIKKMKLKWPVFKWSFKQSFELRYKTKKVLYEFKFNLYGFGIVITSHLRFKFRNFKKESLFPKNLALHQKQVLFILNYIKR